VGRAGEYDDGIDFAGIVCSPVIMHDIDVTPWIEIEARSLGQFAMTRDHVPLWSDDLGKHGRAITRTSSTECSGTGYRLRLRTAP
jgi:hypothetical protein